MQSTENQGRFSTLDRSHLNQINLHKKLWLIQSSGFWIPSYLFWSVILITCLNLSWWHVDTFRSKVIEMTFLLLLFFQLPQMHLTLPDTAGVLREPGINPPTVGSLSTTVGPPEAWTPVQVVEITNRRSCKCSCNQLTPSRDKKKSNEPIGLTLTGFNCWKAPQLSHFMRSQLHLPPAGLC